MGLKGMAKIELTNVKTGEVEIIEKHNLVTNAVPDVLKNTFGWQTKSAYTESYLAGHIMPLCPNLFGGILLYQDKIPEDPNQFFPQSTNKLIGYSSNDVGDASDIMRGSMNQTESGPLASGDGYRFVFDFATSQANGTIGAVGLTSKFGGAAGYGSKEIPGYFCVPAEVFVSKTNIYNYDDVSKLMLMHYDRNTDIATAAYVSGSKIITITRIQLNAQKWKLVKDYTDVENPEVKDTQIIETQTFAAYTGDGNRYYNFCGDGEYIWGFEQPNNKAGNKEGNATINWIKIKVSDLSFEEGTWEIEAKLYRFGVYELGLQTARSVPIAYSLSCVLDGFLYCFDYDLTGVYKINTENITDVTFIEHPDKKAYSSSVSFTGMECGMAAIGNKVVGSRFYINGDSMIAVNANSVSAYTVSKKDRSGLLNYPHNVADGPMMISFGDHYTATWYQSRLLCLVSPYLATINNLAAPVEKTADKTMKITYILREEAEDNGTEEGQA